MRPVNFPEQNVVMAKDQKEYLPLPAFKSTEGNGLVISKWKFTWKERLMILIGRPLWVSVYTFHHPLQPQLPSLEYPFLPKPRRPWKFKRLGSARWKFPWMVGPITFYGWGLNVELKKTYFSWKWKVNNYAYLSPDGTPQRATKWFWGQHPERKKS